MKSFFQLSLLVVTYGSLLFTGVSWADGFRDLQTESVRANRATWGHWGPDTDKYSSWSSHSNRLIPVYSFGIELSSVRGEHSVYRNAGKLQELYGYLPEGTVNPQAEYFDQTDVYKLQRMAADQGKKCIVLIIFDGMDWQTTWAAAIARSGNVEYRDGRGTGLRFQDYRGTTTDFGFCVTSPHDDGTVVDVNKQQIVSPGSLRGGYHAESGGNFPWDEFSDPNYPLGKGTEFKHAYADSAASASALMSGTKTYNDSINVDASGRQVAPIAQQLQLEGFAVGAITSVPISHATPACAYANNVHRDDYQDLTRDMLGLPSIAHPDNPLPGLDVFLGAGWGEDKDQDRAQGDNFVSGNRYITTKDLESIDVICGGQYEVCQRTNGKPGRELLADSATHAAKQHRRLFGLFGIKSGHLPFQTADGQYDPTINAGQTQSSESYSSHDISENPTLSEMTVAALDVLASRSNRIWLMIEAGDVDWANHSNNIDNSIGAVFSGDESFHAVTQWIEKHTGWDNSVVLVTADHGHYLVIDKPGELAAKSGQ